MDWLGVKIYTTTEGLEHVGGMLLMLGIDGYVIEDKNDFEEFLNQTEPHWDYVDDSLNRLKNVESSITFYVTDDLSGREQISFVKSELERLKKNDKDNILGRLEIEVSGLKQEDWENGWKKYFKSFCVGEKLIIVPSWENKPKDNSRKILTIDPGMSFGTGQHHTTKLCIEALEKYVKNGNKILDLGSGSGILSIASLILGAEKATAVDIDEFAVKVSKENAALNNFFDDKYVAFTGDITSDLTLKEKIAGKYDIIVANIVADVIIAFAPLFKEYMSKDTVLICSGIIEHRLNDVKSKLLNENYKIISENKDSDWYELEIKL